MIFQNKKPLALLTASLCMWGTAQVFALDGTDVAPGASCSNEDAVMVTANAGGNGGYILTCESGTWVAQMNAATPTANAHAATKQYVDTAAAAGGLEACTNNDTALCGLETSRNANDPDFVAGNIRSGTNILGVTGSMASPASDCTNDATTTCTLDATRANDDSDFTAANIKDGVNILGVTGSYAGGGGGLCTGPAECPNVGDVCDDSNAGTTNDPIFAGCANYGGTYEQLFVTDNNQSTSSQWKTSTGTNDIATDHSDDGKMNDAQVPNSTDFPAFKLCKDLTDGGYSDWYLPARSELNVLWENRTAINANAVGDFMPQAYWSSTEYNTNDARFIFLTDFTGTTISSFTKSGNSDVRCVRRGGG